MDLNSMNRPKLREYALALILVFGALGLSLLGPWVEPTVPYSLFFVAAMAVAARAGAGPAVFAVVLGAIAAQYAAVSGGHRISLIALTQFVMMSGVAAWGVSARRVQLQKERKLTTIVEDLKRENQELNRFRSSASHELVQSLGAITNYAEVIRGSSTGNVAVSAANIIDVATRAAANIRKQCDDGSGIAQTTEAAAKPRGEAIPGGRARRAPHFLPGRGSLERGFGRDQDPLAAQPLPPPAG